MVRMTVDFNLRRLMPAVFLDLDFSNCIDPEEVGRLLRVLPV